MQFYKNKKIWIVIRKKTKGQRCISYNHQDVDDEQVGSDGGCEEKLPEMTMRRNFKRNRTNK